MTAGRNRRAFVKCSLLNPAFSAAPAEADLAANVRQPVFAPVGSYATGLGTGSAEGVAFARGRIFVTNSKDNSFDIVSIGDPDQPTLIRRVPLAAYGAGPNSIAVSGGVVAVAVEADPKTDPGNVLFFDLEGDYLNQAMVGALPDMLVFTPDGRHLLVANEGEPDGAVNPEGSVSIISMPRFAWILPYLPPRMMQQRVRTADLRHFSVQQLQAAGVRLSAGVLPAQDLEPEYITVSHDSRRAWVTLQENNAIGLLDIQNARFEWVRGLGLKDHNLEGGGLDASDRDNKIHITPWPVLGMYQPDAIAAFTSWGRTYLITANEGDSRDGEEAKVSNLNLDPASFPNAEALKKAENLGRLIVTTANGDNDGDGSYEQLWAFGARSFSIWTDKGKLVYDSGDEFEQIIAQVNPAHFNATNDSNEFDNRSDNKGPEPEGVAVGMIGRRTYAFIGLERIGGVMIYDVSDPEQPQFVQYTNNRDFGLNPPGPDSGPEILLFIPADQSPDGNNLLLVSNEASGTVTIYRARTQAEEVTLSLLHNNDGESSLLPFTNTVGETKLPVGGVAAFKTLTDLQIRQAREAAHSVLNVYAGDAFLASSTLACSLPPNPPGTPIYDALAQRRIPYDAHILGNHEFDFSPDFLERFIREFEINGVLNQPFLSANLDFGDEPGFDDLVDLTGLIEGYSTNGRVVAQSAIITDKLTGQRFGIVSATTPLLPTISSPRNVLVTSQDIAGTAAVVQTEIDRLMRNPRRIQRIIFISHLQDLSNDKALIALLRGVDLAVAGGGDELLVNPAIPLSDQLLPGETTTPFGDYPLKVTDADGRTVYVVTTSGNYKYLGRLDVTFNAKGEVKSVLDTSYPRRVIPLSAASQSLGLVDAVEPDPAILAEVIEPVQTCLEALGQPIAATEVLLNVARGSVSTPGVRSCETNAGNLVADGFLFAYDTYGPENGLPPRDAAVVALQNGGGIRQNAGDVLPVGAAVPGTLSRQNTLDVLAFLTNSVTVVQGVTPAELKQILERSASSIGGGQFLQVGGLKVVYDLSKTAQVIQTDGTVTTQGERVVNAELTDGTQIIKNGTVVPGAPSLAIVTNSFTAAGGDNYPWFAANPNKVQFPATYEQAWVEYLLSFPTGLQGLPTVPASDPRYQPGGEGRIMFIQ
jgi:2',3'-cyclic-nucleotide 2'-phosphodiesterase (5'-nucleotidase family)